MEAEALVLGNLFIMLDALSFSLSLLPLLLIKVKVILGVADLALGLSLLKGGAISLMKQCS